LEESHMDWRKTVKDPREVEFFEALKDPNFLWRTKRALQEASGMTSEQVEATISKYAYFIREGRSQSGEPIWALQERYWRSLGTTQILDFMSNMATSSVKA
jgi:hypothetical protein